MEAKTRLQPPKPLEGNKGNPASSSENWRAKKKVTFGEDEDDGEESAAESDQRPRIVEKKKNRQSRTGCLGSKSPIKAISQ